MSRRVLLLEPNYKNKYPPIGLMKLAMYHRLQGDEVVFYKGDLPAFVLSQVVDDALAKLLEIDTDFEWRKHRPEIQTYIKSGKITQDITFEQALQRPLVQRWLEHFRKYFRSREYYTNPRWNRVCVTTLFTFHWNQTIKTIEFAKKVCRDPEQVLVGGILASVVPDKVKDATGIKPHIGSLNVTKLPGDKKLPRPFGRTPIDALPLDYSILEEIDYRYPATDAYYAYATRGCVNTCAFCAVPILEPDYCGYIPLKTRLKKTEVRFGEQRHLLLLDNNIFASDEFDKIIDEIRDSGFSKGAKFVPLNHLDIAIRQLQSGWNNRAYIRLAVRLLNAFVEKLDGECHDYFYSLLMNHGLLHDYTATEDGVLTVYAEVKEDYEKARSKKPIVRFIDFNQGLDARLATPEKMAKLATVAIRPLRIAFDSWNERKHYVRAISLAKENDITHMSNYLLYNFKDRPVDLYRRLLLNIDLCEALGVNIYSFPMKYHPIMDEEWFSNRNYIGSHWTRKAVRTVQAVLNSTLGKIGRGRTFFYKAFGRNEAEFHKLIRMPEAFIIKRWDAELSGLTAKWEKAYTALNDNERRYVNKIVSKHVFNPKDWVAKSAIVRKVLKFYLVKREDIPAIDESIKARRILDFELSCPGKISTECRRLLVESCSERR